MHILKRGGKYPIHLRSGWNMLVLPEGFSIIFSSLFIGAARAADFLPAGRAVLGDVAQQRLLT